MLASLLVLVSSEIKLSACTCSCVASENHQALVKFLTEKGSIPGLFEGKVWLGDLNINGYKFQFIVLPVFDL